MKLGFRYKGIKKVTKIVPKKSLKKNSSNSMPAMVKKAQAKLKEICHAFVKDRDGIPNNYRRSGICCTCGRYCEGGDYQAGHYEPSGSCGALLRYHPQNIHGQGGFCCNINRNHQQKMGNDYTFYMIKRYGQKRVAELRALKRRNIKASLSFYEKMIELYETRDEKKIIKYLESLPYF